MDNTTTRMVGVEEKTRNKNLVTCYLCDHKHGTLTPTEAKFIFEMLKTCTKHADEMKALMGRSPGEEG